ncbi:unnamed protein product [Adineta ricciae]|uniref:PH domain-containing protein n=1 Tax=Adineta ricciae TaxID=249248 RepID=A0A814Y6M0_ADIRI|nr:unnamed protein product [Adineta ricciae]
MPVFLASPLINTIDENPTSSASSQVFNRTKQSSNSNATISSLAAFPNTNRSTTDNPIKSDSNTRPQFGLSYGSTPAMQNLTNSAGTGIVQPHAFSQQPLNMQSTTPSVANGKDELRGWLYKWTNYLKGYQKRWFVLQAGILSYYRSQDEMTHACRGTIYLESAHLSSNDFCHFVISNGSTVIHLRTSSETDKQRWMNALETARQKALKIRRQYQDSDEEVSTIDELNEQQRNLGQPQASPNDSNKSPNNDERAELTTMNKAFDAKLEDLKMCMDLINRHYQALCRTLGDLEQLDKTEATVNAIKSVNERATLFRITSTAMLNACQELVQLIQSQGRRWQKSVQVERDARIRLEHMCEQIALQSVKLEKRVQRASRSEKQNLLSGRSALTSLKSSDLRGTTEGANLSDDEEFYDAIDDPQTIGVFRIPLQQHVSNNDKQSPNIVADDVSSCNDDDSESEEQDENSLPMVIVKAAKKDEANTNAALPAQTTTEETVSKPVVSTQQHTAVAKRKRRDRIPERPNYSVNLWSIVKNCVGKDLTKIPIPVNFSEPISMLQRITEELEYSSVLDTAAKINDSWEQLAYVAAFTISSYSTTTTRVNKPFNPLLGETFECDRTDDLGWKSIAEQVSHHPPALSTYAEGQGWTLYQEFTMTSKFRGQYLSITPLGYSHLIFKNTGNHFTWRKVTTLVNNIIVGKLWIDNVGEMDINNHTTKDVCKLKYFPYSYFSKDVPRKVTGVVTDVDGQARWVLTGMIEILLYRISSIIKLLIMLGTWTEKIEGGPVEASSGRHAHSHHMETRNMKLLWQRKMPPAHLENMYNFTQLAVELNEMEPDVAPTDSRHRPDQRLMEEGRWDEANQEKLRLEEKQRQARHARETNGQDPYKSKWFKKQHDAFTDSDIHMYTNEYWECKQKQDWSRCENIY